MSKQFEVKKESLSLINKTFSDSSKNLSIEEQYKALEQKYKGLADLTKTLEKVYQFHKGIIQNISGGIITIDFDEKITFINTAALKVLAYDYNEIVGLSVRSIFADADVAAQIVNDLLVNKHMFESKEVTLISRTEKIIPIGFSTTFLKVKDTEYDSVIITFRDLTNLYNFRIQMERIDRLATLGEVSAGIAHEIRNPLAGIKTSAQVLEESFAPGDFRSELVTRIVKEIDRSNELLKKFFKFARPGKPKQENSSINSIIQGVYLLLASKMEKKKVEFKTFFDKSLPDAYVDENQIEQVLINLFLNAFDAMNKGGKLIVRTASIMLDGNEIGERKNMVLIEVEDTGEGIDKNNIEKIYNPFFTTKSDGVGLGLSISSRLIEENGGKLAVKSELKKGTKFSVYLPTN
jgi:PAS domain S-box-containing protein